MVFKIGLLVVLFLIIGQIDEVINSIERLNKTIQEESGHDYKDPYSM